MVVSVLAILCSLDLSSSFEHLAAGERSIANGFRLQGAELAGKRSSLVIIGSVFGPYNRPEQPVLVTIETLLPYTGPADR
jgi:hypothetical protein